jgi:hypothetical protein
MAGPSPVRRKTTDDLMLGDSPNAASAFCFSGT